MSDYRLDRLNTREFEHLSQALCKKFIAVGVTPFGDGPDGGREATFDGAMDYPSSQDPWSGYLVVQCKFRQRSKGDTTSDTDWVTKELTSELKKYCPPSAGSRRSAKKARPRRPPEYYIFVTNAVLTGNNETGGHDKCAAIINSYASRIGIKKFSIWGFDEIRTYLDCAPEIRQTYLGFILPDDILHRALTLLSIDEPDFEKILANYLQKELQADYAAKLESAGQHDEKKLIPLSKVFIDLPFTSTKEQSLSSADTSETLARHLVFNGNSIIHATDKPQKQHVSSIGRFAIVGGPGQGKSTIGQYLCQLYRAAILSNCKTLDPHCSEILDGINSASEEKSHPEVKSQRFPFRIILNRFATDLAKNESLTITEYIRLRIEKLGSMGSVSTSSLKKWISNYPWIFVLDGLDEVPSSSNRAQVLEAIQHFLVELSVAKADAVIVATTRPQGYADEFAKSHFQHLYLTPLSRSQALHYGRALLEFRANGDLDKFETTRRRLASAADNEATMRLMSTPLQVTIMATLVERHGEPPKQRYRLFEEYYRTIYTRETNREGAHSDLLRDRKTDIDTIHYRTGLLLQAESELAGTTAALLSLPRFNSLVQQRLNEIGMDEEECGRLTHQITTSALDRLIFLVSPQDDEVGFEIRSLQEFMAAEAIARGSTEQISRRIYEIAPITNWRNVFLFLFGKLCAEDSTALLDRITLLCDEMNDPKQYPAYASAKWGSRLALDILSDGAARPAPNRERKLLRTAFELLDTGFLYESRDFSAVYHDRLEDMYRQKIDSMMTKFDMCSSLPAWHLLDVLALRGIPWAKETHRMSWEKLSDEAKCRVPPMEFSIYNNWHLSIALDTIPKLPVRTVFSMLGGYEFQRNRELEKDWPAWLVSLYDIHDDYWSIRSESPSTSVPIEIEFHGERQRIVIYHTLISNQKKKNTDVEALKCMPHPNKDWESLFSCLEFANNPNKETLSRALKLINLQNNKNGVHHNYWIRTFVPWPLAALLDQVKYASSAEDLAARAEAGEFGDFDDWMQAEMRSKQAPVLCNIEKLSSTSPYDKETLKHGLPLAGSYYTGNPDEDGEADRKRHNTEFAARVADSQKGKPAELWASRFLTVRIYDYHRGKLTSENKGGPLSIAAVCSFFRSVSNGIRLIDPAMATMITDREHSPEELRQALDALASSRNDTIHYKALSEISKVIRNQIDAEKFSKQSISWANWAVKNGVPMALPKLPLEMSPAWDDLTPANRALLRLGASDLSEEECKAIIDNLSHDRELQITNDLIGTLINRIEEMPRETADRLRDYAMNSFSPNTSLEHTKFPENIYGYSVYEHLDEKRSSLLSSNKNWTDLGLFPIPQ